jgi:phage repressor protein C with HTH and peptisase S24 domain
MRRLFATGAAYDALHQTQKRSVLALMAHQTDVDVGANIRRLRRAKNLTLEQVAAASNTDTGNLSRLERGKQGYTDEGLKAIAEVLGVPVSAFFQNPSSEPTARTGEPDVVSYSATARADVVEVPLLSTKGSMGKGLGIEMPESVVDHIRLHDQWIRRHLTVSAPSNLAVISARGDSMEDTFSDGDVLLVDRGVADVRLDAVYVLAIDDELYIKRVQRRMDGGLTIISDNKKYEPFVIGTGERDKFGVQGRVVWAWRGKKL